MFFAFNIFSSFTSSKRFRENKAGIKTLEPPLSYLKIVMFYPIPIIDIFIPEYGK